MFANAEYVNASEWPSRPRPYFAVSLSFNPSDSERGETQKERMKERKKERKKKGESEKGREKARKEGRKREREGE